MTGSEFSPQEAVERALAASRSDDCVVIAEETSGANLRWAGNTLTTNGVSRSRQLTVIAIDRRTEGASAGVISRAGIRADQIEDVVREAEHAAAEATPAEDAEPLAGSETDGPLRIKNDEPRWESPPGRTEIGVLRDFAATLGETLREARAADRKLYGFAEHELVSTFLGTSGGLRRRYDQPTGRVELNAKSADLTRSAWTGAATRDFTDVDIAGLDAGLSERLDWAKRSISLPAGRYETLLPPTAVSDLMIYLYWSAGAKDAADGRTVFSKAGGGTRVGEQLSTHPVTLSSDPLAAGLRCPPFVIAHASGPDSSVFDNGLPLRSTAWIQDGSLAALHSSRHSAALAGLPVAPAIDNLILAVPSSGPNSGPASGAGAPTLAEMIASTGRALLLTCLWYIREVDPQVLLLTGLTRDGVYLVEDGEVVGAVNNFRFNESPVAMLGRLLEVGATVPTLPREWGDYFNRAAMPPLRVEGFNMSSVSQANLKVRPGSRGLGGEAYRGRVRLGHAGRGRSQVHMVTQARRSLSDDISFRQRRYLLMMAIRAVCFVIAVIMFVNHLGWLVVIPAVGAIVIPYFAVVFANGGREPSNTRGFMEYRPNLPATRDPAGPSPGNEHRNGHRPARPGSDN